MESPPGRRWVKYLRPSLRSLLALVFLIGTGLGCVVHRSRIQRDAVASIERAGGKVWYDWEWTDGGPKPNGVPSWPKWMVNLIGVDYFANVTWVYARRATDAELVHIGALSRLDCLVLPGSSVTDAGLVHLKGLRDLRVLSLQNTSITDAGLIHIKSMMSLQELGINDTEVGDAGLAQLADLHELRVLGIENTRSTKAGVSRIKKALPKAKIRR